MPPCKTPVSWADLVMYWSRDDEAETDRIEEHVMGCATCAADSEVVAKLALAVRDFVPTTVTRAHIGRLRDRGAKITENAFLPSVRKAVIFPLSDDFLIHRLTGLDLSRADRVELTVRTEGTGAVIHTEKNIPFDTHEGVLIACQRHFVELPPDTVFELRATDAMGNVQVEAAYPIPHQFG
jgi:hypothetical protein